MKRPTSWRCEHGCGKKDAAMWEWRARESTGCQFIGAKIGFFELVVANAQHIKGVPGRKTDVQDAEWIADLVQHGLLTASFVPSQEQQDVRDLTRMRVSLVQERARLVNRVHKVLAEAGIQLSTVLSEVMGLSGRAILNALCAGESDPVRLAKLMHRSVHATQEQVTAV
jgi:transposase